MKPEKHTAVHHASSLTFGVPPYERERNDGSAAWFPFIPCVFSRYLLWMNANVLAIARDQV